MEKEKRRGEALSQRLAGGSAFQSFRSVEPVGKTGGVCDCVNMAEEVEGQWQGSEEIAVAVTVVVVVVVAVVVVVYIDNMHETT